MLLRDLQRASFRGVPFLVPSDELSEGRTALDHLYPDAFFRYAEDNGGIPPKFKISAVLAEPNLPAKVRALRRALTQQGPGTLKHPWIGAQFVQVDGAFTIKRSDKEAGQVDIEIKFLVTGPPQFPSLASGISAVVSGLAATAVVDLFREFVAAYGDPFPLGAVSVAGNRADDRQRPRERATGVVDALSAKSLSLVSDAIGDLGTVLVAHMGSASAAPARIVEQSGLLAHDSTAFSTLMVQSIRSAFDDETIEDRVLTSGFSSLADAAVEIVAQASDIVATTVDLANRKVALAILGGYAQAAAFIGLAESVAVRRYDTADEVETDEILLVSHYELLQERDLPASVRAALRDIYVAASEVLRDAAVRLPRIVSVPAFNTPASVLAYMLYEDRFERGNVVIVEDRAAMLVKLNLDQTPLLLAGDAAVVMRDA